MKVKHTPKGRLLVQHKRLLRSIKKDRQRIAVCEGSIAQKEDLLQAIKVKLDDAEATPEEIKRYSTA